MQTSESLGWNETVRGQLAGLEDQPDKTVWSSALSKRNLVQDSVLRDAADNIRDRILRQQKSLLVPKAVNCRRHETRTGSGFGLPCNWIGNSGAQQILYKRFRSSCMAGSLASHSRTSINTFAAFSSFGDEIR